MEALYTYDDTIADMLSFQISMNFHAIFSMIKRNEWLWRIVFILNQFDEFVSDKSNTQRQRVLYIYFVFSPTSILIIHSNQLILCGQKYIMVSI